MGLQQSFITLLFPLLMVSELEGRLKHLGTPNNVGFEKNSKLGKSFCVTTQEKYVTYSLICE